MIFPIVGLAMLLGGMKKRLAYIRILNVGKVALGEFVRMERTNATVNNKPVMRMFFSYIADDGQTYLANGETHQTYKLQDEKYEPLVYNPNEAVMIGSLPCVVRHAFEQDIEYVKSKKVIEE